MKNPVFGIHGYDHDPEDPYNSAMRIPDGHYHIWENMLEGFEFEGFNWYSGLKFSGLWKAIINGHLTTYGYAYNDLSKNVAHDIVKHFKLNHKLQPGSSGKYDLIAHSLGTKAALHHMELSPNFYRHAVLMNGAASIDHAHAVISSNPDTKFLNIVVKTDDVLHKFGRWRTNGGTIGQKGLKPMANLHQVILDDETSKRFYRSKFGWELNGDNPMNVSDHSYTFLNHNNHPLIRHFLEFGSFR